MAAKKRLSSVDFVKATGHGAQSQKDLATEMSNPEKTIQGERSVGLSEAEQLFSAQQGEIENLRTSLENVVVITAMDTLIESGFTISEARAVESTIQHLRLTSMMFDRTALVDKVRKERKVYK